METTPMEAGDEDGLVRLLSGATRPEPGSAIDFRLIADKSLSLILVADNTGVIQYVNPVFCETTGFGAAEVIGRRIQDLGELDPGTVAELRNSLGFGLPWRGEFAANKKNGARFWMHSSISPITDGEGHVTQFLAVNLDITDRIRAEEALRQSEEMFRTLVDTMPAAVVIFQGSHVRYANRTCFEVLGYSPEDLPKLNYWDAIHPDFRDLVRERGNARLRGEDVPNNYELRFLKKAGEPRWGIYSGAPVTYQGKPAVLGTIYDITDRKEAEQALRQSEERFRKLAETTTAATFIFEGARIRYANGAAGSITGYPVAELVGKSFWEIAHPDLEAITKKHLDTVAPGEPIPSRSEIGVVTMDGQTRWLDLNMGFVEIDGRELVLGTAFDITERKAAEEALRKNQQQLQVALESGGMRTWEIAIGRSPWGGMLRYDTLLRHVCRPDRARVEASLRRSIRHGAPFNEDFRVKTLGGGHRWAGLRGVVERDDAGLPSRLVGVLADITERKDAEDALRQSEERYRILYQDNPSMYFTLAEDLSVLSVNRHGAEQLGYTPEELVGESVLLVVHPDDEAHVRRQMESLVRHRGARHGLEFRKVHKDGRVVWVKESVRISHDMDGQRIVLVVCEDISERKQLEEAMQGLREELERKADRAVAGKNPYGLSFREITVLHLVTGGRSDKEIGVILGIRPQTVSKHVANVLKKMRASSRTEAGVRALREGLIE